MFYCLLDVTAEHAAGRMGNAEQDLGTGALLQWEGMDPPVPPAQGGHCPHGDNAGTTPALGSAGAGQEGLVLRSSGGWR